VDYLAKVRAEARDAYAWSNGPGERYAEHEHSYTKLLYCTDGSIEFRTGDGRTIRLAAGDRTVLPAGTRHSALVGPRGVSCVEGKLPSE
jgi:quercetin dioxygenase-like cupin family protein